jgi:type I restriction enzyme S subunit
MGVMPGYKQTDVGVFPEDWETKACSALSDLITVGIVVRPTQYYTKQGVPALRSANIRADGIDDADMVFISEDANALLSKSQVRTGDVLTVRTGYPGTSAVVPASHAGSNCIDILITRPSKAVSSRYLSAWINSSFGKYQVLRNQGGLAQQHFNVGDLRNLIVVLPKKAEQEVIANALSDADALIESTEQLIVKKRYLKQGTMQKLLSGKARLPGFTGEWQQKKLCELGECLIGLTYKPSNVKSDGLLVLRSSNIFQETLRFEDNVFVDMDVPAAIILRKGDILICVRNGSRDLIGKCALINEEAQGLTFGAFMAVFRTPFYNFVYHQFQSDFIKRQINEHLGATINQITNKSLNSFQILFPMDEEERAAIAVILSDMDVEITTLEAKLGKARELKLGMMQDLLTGRVRLV